MTHLVDANVFSEVTKPLPNPSVVAWLRENAQDIVVDPLILGEIRFGILLLAPGRRRSQLEEWFQDVVASVVCIPWDATTGLRWARLAADLRASGKAMSIKDSLIASTALVHGFTVATRNDRDFRWAGVPVFNPFR